MRLTQPIWTRFLPTRTVVGWATLGPIGRRLPAPGTWGSLAGCIYFFVVFFDLPAWENVVLSAVGAYVAVAFCGEAEFRLGRKDPGEVILDEFVAMPLCFLGFQGLDGPTPHWMRLALLGGGFAVFRLFDIAKPFGIRRLQDLPGGWGIVVDDTAAALATCAVLHGAKFLWARF